MDESALQGLADRLDRLESLERPSAPRDSERQLEKIEREIEYQRTKLDKREQNLVRAVALTIASPIVAGIFALIGIFINDQPPPQPTTETVSVCTNAILNTRKAIDAGVRDPNILEKINTEAIDAQCGEEADIARDILTNK